MDKKELWKLAEKMGTTKENFEYGIKENKEEYEQTIIEVSKFLK